MLSTTFLYGIYSGFKNLAFARGIFMIFLGFKGFTGTQIGILQSLLFLTSVCSEVPAGFFGDKFGRRLSVLMGTGLFVISGLGYLFCDEYYSFVVLYILEGMGMAFTSGSDEALLYDHMLAEGKSEKFLKYSSRFQAIGYYSLGISTFVGGLLQAISWDAVYGAYTVAMAIAFMAFFLIKEKCVNNEDKGKEPTSNQDVKFKDVFVFCSSEKGKQLLLLVLIVAIFDGAILAYFMFNQPLFDYYGLTPAWIGLIYSISRYTSGLGFWLAPHLERKLHLDKLMYITFAISGFLLFLVCIPVPLYAVVIFFLVNILPNVIYALVNNVVHRQIDSSFRASFLSVKSMIESGAISILYVLIGGMLDQAAPNIALAYVGIVPVLCIVMLYFISDRVLEVSE